MVVDLDDWLVVPMVEHSAIVSVDSMVDRMEIHDD